MTHHPKPIESQRPSALLIAYRLDHGFSMESRLSWFRATQAAEQYETTVICAETQVAETHSIHAPPRGTKLPKDICVVRIPHSWIERAIMSVPGCFYLAYRLWHRRVFQAARKMHRQRAFSLVHLVSYCGYREPGQCWRLDAPFVWGPIGGTQNFPLRFVTQLDFRGAAKEVLRNCFNEFQLRFSFRIRRALQASASVLAANREVQSRLADSFGVASRRQLETGVSEIKSRPPSRRNKSSPFRILWTGRLESWKALPLLLQALAKLPEEVSYELRIVGAGRCERRWKRLAARLKLKGRVEWAGWPPYEARMPHYLWADVFAFTSLRDTSGTGLVESLACGVPIIGLDHQGAHDVMTDDCSIRVPVGSASQVVDDLSQGICQLAADRDLLQCMRTSALKRAAAYHWDRLAEKMSVVYREAIERPSRPSVRRVEPQRLRKIAIDRK